MPAKAPAPWERPIAVRWRVSHPRRGLVAQADYFDGRRIEKPWRFCSVLVRVRTTVTGRTRWTFANVERRPRF